LLDKTRIRPGKTGQDWIRRVTNWDQERYQPTILSLVRMLHSCEQQACHGSNERGTPPIHGSNKACHGSNERGTHGIGELVLCSRVWRRVCECLI
jgi:hypothetical protein